MRLLQNVTFLNAPAFLSINPNQAPRKHDREKDNNARKTKKNIFEFYILIAIKNTKTLTIIIYQTAAFVIPISVAWSSLICN